MSHLEFIKRAYDQCEIEYMIFDCDTPGYQILILVGDLKDRYIGLNANEARRIAKSYMEFLNGELMSY